MYIKAVNSYNYSKNKNLPSSKNNFETIGTTFNLSQQKPSFKKLPIGYRTEQPDWEEIRRLVLLSNQQFLPQKTVLPTISNIAEYIRKYILNAEVTEMTDIERAKILTETKKINLDMNIQAKYYINIIDKQQLLSQKEYLTAELLKDLLVESYQKIRNIYTTLARNILKYNDEYRLNSLILEIFKNEDSRLNLILSHENSMRQLAEKFHKPMTKDVIDDMMVEMGKLQREMTNLQNFLNS